MTDRTPILFARPDIHDDDVAEVTRVLRSGWLTTGSECRRLEEDLEAYLGVDHVVGVSSCTAALEIALAYLDLPRGSRVGVPAWTFVSTALAAVRNGLQPVLIDVEADALNLSPTSLATALDDGLDAVIAVHFGGVPVAREVRDLCAAAGVALVEDAAHALGAEDDRGPVGGPGAVATCFSFYATKNLTSAEGGALTTDDVDLARFARSYRLHGMSADAWDRYTPDGTLGYDMEHPGIKGNLPDVLAALARSQLVRFRTSQRRRRELLAAYRATLEPAGIRFVPATTVAGSADHLAVILVPEGTDRRCVVAGLKAHDIHPSVHFRPLHQFRWFAANADVVAGGLPVSEALAPRALSLPLHVCLDDGDVERTCERVIELLR